jgi:hypothetical protein
MDELESAVAETFADMLKGLLAINKKNLVAQGLQMRGPEGESAFINQIGPENPPGQFFVDLSNGYTISVEVNAVSNR